MIIREWKNDDNAVVSKLDSECFKDCWTCESFKQTANSPCFVGFIAEDKQIVGYIVALIACENAEILKLAVKKEFRRQKLAQALIERLFEQCSKANVKQILLEVRSSNQAAQELYSKVGFKILTLRKNYYENAEDAVVMTKSL